MKVLAAAFGLLLLGCQRDSPAPPPVASGGATSAAGPASASTSRDGSCGPLRCTLFDRPEQALAKVLAERPVVLAIGEAHAQRGDPDVPSATKHFTDSLLPALKGRASHLVVELMVADGKCGATEKKVAQTQSPVVKEQRDTNQSDFVKLAHVAKELGVVPFPLRPSCADYQAVVKAGPDGVIRMLAMIADLTEQKLAKLLATRTGDQLLVAYGGALHNDAVPGPGREKWSFGPRLIEATGGRYLELDLIVPELIKDTDAWRRLPWYPHFDKRAHPDKVTLYQTGERSFALVLPAHRPR